MHKELAKLLPRATGFSEFAVVVTVDIRAFSAFSTKEESPAVAEFIKKFYTHVIRKHFPRPRFFKPTGDGLMIVCPYTQRTLQAVTTKAVSESLSLLSDFPSFCAEDPMINFQVPDKLGIGLARGPVCGLMSGGKILDYSGRPLNLSSRLTDLARPSGIVFDDAFDIDLLPPEVATKFGRAEVYIRSVAERHPIGICFMKDRTVIPAASQKPIVDIKWRTEAYTHTLKVIKSLKRRRHHLKLVPVDPEQIKVEVMYPKVVRGRRRPGWFSYHDFRGFDYHLEAGRPLLRLDCDALATYLSQKQVKDQWEVTINIRYPEP